MGKHWDYLYMSFWLLSTKLLSGSILPIWLESNMLHENNWDAKNRVAKNFPLRMSVQPSETLSLVVFFVNTQLSLLMTLHLTNPFSDSCERYTPVFRKLCLTFKRVDMKPLPESIHSFRRVKL